jgi:hypothetical protein
MLSTGSSTKARLTLPTERPLGKGRAKLWQNLGKAADRGAGRSVEIRDFSDLKIRARFSRTCAMIRRMSQGDLIRYDCRRCGKPCEYVALSGGRKRAYCDDHSQRHIHDSSNPKALPVAGPQTGAQKAVKDALYSRMVFDQNDRCGICGERETVLLKDGTVRRLAMDHSHKTGEIRALLCWNCNNLIGRAKERSAVLLQAARYIMTDGASLHPDAVRQIGYAAPDSSQPKSS